MSKELVLSKMLLDKRAFGNVIVRWGVKTSCSQKVQVSQHDSAVLKKMRGWKVQEKQIEREYHAKVGQLAIFQVEGTTQRGQGCLN